MPKFNVTVFYRAKAGFTIDAETPEQALQKALDGADLGEAGFDEPLGNEAVFVFSNAGDDEPLAVWED